jgi:hypothetical protein
MTRNPKIPAIRASLPRTIVERAEDVAADDGIGSIEDRPCGQQRRPPGDDQSG